MWDKYCVHLKSLKAKTGPRSHRINLFANDDERRWLFHGTKSENVPSIIQNGFNRSYGVGCSYGKGCYFARDAALAYSYASPDTFGNRYIFLCRVAVGEWCQGRNGQIVPDAKPYNTVELYDTTVDNVKNPSIFVTYHDAQVYPEYLITFRTN